MAWPLRSDELAFTREWMRDYRPNTPEDVWQQLAPSLELLLAMAAWRSQPVHVRAQALSDALDVVRPVVQRAEGLGVP